MSAPVSDRRRWSAADPIIDATSALVLVGMQNEYFSDRGLLHSDIREVGAPERVLATTLAMIGALESTGVRVVVAPIVFTPDYVELVDPVGALAVIKARGAFQQGTDGARVAEGLESFGPRVLEVGGRVGLDAFANTELDVVLAERGIIDVVVAGALTGVCVASTARSAHEHGYRVWVLSDCILGRTRSENRLYCSRVFPLYAEVMTSADLIAALSEREG